jgi:uncharacterized C2H2 Zn-finger protein
VKISMEIIIRMLSLSLLLIVSDLFAQLDAQIENMMVRGDDRIWQCEQCDKSSVFKNDITRHIEAVHLQNHPGITCDLCGEIVKTRNALRQHKNSRHKTMVGRL